MNHDARGHFTRGGQIFAHKVRMLVQVSKVSLYVSLAVLGVWAVGSLVWTLGGQALYIRLVCYWADFKITLATLLKGRQAVSQVPLSVYHFWGDGWTEGRAWAFVTHPQIQRVVATFDQRLSTWLHTTFLSQGGGVFILSFLMIVGLFSRQGRKKREKILERGVRIVTPQEMTSLLKKKRLVSDLSLEAVPLVAGAETSHILLTGTTGSGKTNAFHTLLPQVRARPNRALIVDLTGDYVRRYYRDGQDILINPYDARSVGWNPWGDCLHAAHYEALAAAIVPPSRGLDSFWSAAGKVVLSAALQKLQKQGNTDVAALHTLLTKSDFGTFCDFFRGTEAAPYTHKDGDKMTHSIRATLASHLKFLGLLGGFKKTFSMRQWIGSEGPKDQWVFLVAKADQRESLRALFSALIDTGINALMSELPDPDRRVWFVMDELPAMNRLPSLERGLAELRKYGGCLMCGVQSVSQLEATYAPQSARTLLGLFNTKIFFRSLDPTTTSWVSRSLGEAETSEHVENVSYGANTIRDGVSLNKNTQTKPIVLPTELAALEDLTCYLKYAGNLPVTKLKMTYKNPTRSVTPFKLFVETLVTRERNPVVEDFPPTDPEANPESFS